MKLHHTFLLCLQLALLPVMAQVPTEPVIDTIPATDNWSPRQPLSAEEQQRRADKKAELEAMRQRFRRYQRKNAEEASQQAAEAAEGDYLWSDAEAPQGPTTTQDSPPERSSAVPDTEDLRLEIGRNLQVKGELSSPRERPRAYEAPAPMPPQAREAWEGEWQAPSDGAEPTAPANTDWAIKLGQSNSTTGQEAAVQTYEAGAIVPLSANFAANGLSLFDAQPELDNWVKRLYEQPGLLIEVRAHAHIDRTNAEADTWSAQRAQAIKNYLLTQGISSDRVTTRAYGKRSPRSFDLSAEGQAQNERLEVIILQQ